jgi:hypothetical protein
MGDTVRNKDAKRILDKSEGQTASTGAAMHARERHADKADAELIARFHGSFRVGQKFSTFKSPADQNAALSAYFKTPAGIKELAEIKKLKKNERRSLTNVAVGSSSITVRFAEGATNVQGQGYAECYDAKLRKLTAVIEGDGKQGWKVVTCFPTEGHPV